MCHSVRAHISVRDSTRLRARIERLERSNDSHELARRLLSRRPKTTSGEQTAGDCVVRAGRTRVLCSTRRMRELVGCGRRGGGRRRAEPSRARRMADKRRTEPLRLRLCRLSYATVTRLQTRLFRLSADKSPLYPSGASKTLLARREPPRRFQNERARIERAARTKAGRARLGSPLPLWRSPPTQPRSSIWEFVGRRQQTHGRAPSLSSKLDADQCARQRARRKPQIGARETPIAPLAPQAGR